MVTVAKLALQDDPPEGSVGIKAELIRTIQKYYDAQIRLVYLIDNLPDDQATEISDLVEEIKELASEEFELARLDSQFWQWIAARVFFLHFGYHLEDLQDPAPSANEAVDGPRVIDIREILMARLKPGESPKKPA